MKSPDIDLDKLLAELRERVTQYPELTPAPGARPTRGCVPLSRIGQGLARRDFTAAEREHFAACLWCGRARAKLAPVKREDVERWLAGAERLVKFVAGGEGDALGLARDPDRDQDALHHAFMKAREAHDADPAVFASARHAQNWALNAARWYVHDQARRARTRKEHEGGYSRPRPAADHSALWAEIRAALARVSDAARALLEPYLAGESVTAMAERLGVDREPLYPQVQKALAELRKELNRRGVTAADITRAGDVYEEGGDEPPEE